ncbi:Palmitoyltransferase [Cryptotrichosporon argae]
MTRRDWGRIWVGFTLLLISFIAYSSQILVIWPWYGSTLSVGLLKLLVPFNLLVAMVFWTYSLCVRTSPGAVPHGWRPDTRALEGMEVKRGSFGPRYCKTCRHYKPPRAHHCRQCNTCVLKVRPMLTDNDSVLTPSHHCPWIANCVGFYNQGHFIRFLLWVDMATFYHLCMLGSRVYDYGRYSWTEPTLRELLFIIFNFAACAPVFLCVFFFSIYHVYLATGNSTTIEGWEKDKVATLVRRGKIKEIKYPYHIGLVPNLRSVLGPNPLTWLWPQPMRGDGLSFPVNPDAAPGAQYAWPPADPTRLPNPVRPRHASAFVYGDGLNPALEPSSMRRRSNPDQRGERGDVWPGQHEHGLAPDVERQVGWAHTHDAGYSSSERSSSSPEPYLSDYDDDEWDGPHRRRKAGKGGQPGGQQEEDDNDNDDNDDDVPLAHLPTRVRRGSEGYEVRSRPAWETGELDWAHGVTDAQRERWAERPWEERGRYNVYDPDA